MKSVASCKALLRKGKSVPLGCADVGWARARATVRVAGGSSQGSGQLGPGRGQAEARGHASGQVRESLPQVRISPCPRQNVSAVASRLKWRIGRTRPLRCWWSRSNPLFRCLDLRCSTVGRTLRRAGG
jgi:hypothetical protein